MSAIHVPHEAMQMAAQVSGDSSEGEGEIVLRENNLLYYVAPQEGFEVCMIGGNGGGWIVGS